MTTSVYIDDDDDWSPAPQRREKRKWERKSLVVARNVKPPESPPQIAELAFNIHGWALEDMPTIIGRNKFQKINAYSSTMQKGGFEQKIIDLQSQNTRDIYRADLTFTPRELDPDLPKYDPSVHEYLVVGYTLQEEDPTFRENPTFHRNSDNELIGESMPHDQNMIRWHTVRTPIYVVTPVKMNTGTSVRLFALIMPRGGLCQPVLIGHERIFYRWEYRASAGKRSDQRNRNWNQIVIDKAYELMSPETFSQPSLERLPKRKQQWYPRSPTIKFEDEAVPDGSDLNLSSAPLSIELDLDQIFSPTPAAMDLTLPHAPSMVITRIEVNVSSADVRGIVHQIRTSSNARMTGELRATLRELELTHMTPSADLPGLNQLLSSGVKYLSSEDAACAAEEIKQLFPQLVRVALPESIQRIKETLIKCDLTLEYEHLEHYLKDLLLHLRMNPMAAIESVRNRFNKAQSEVCHLDNSMRLQPSSARVNVDTIFVVNLLKEIFYIHNWQTSAVMTYDPMRNPAPLSLKQCRVVHGFDVNLDRACEGYVEAAKWLIDAARRRSCGTDDIVAWLIRLLECIQLPRC